MKEVKGNQNINSPNESHGEGGIGYLVSLESWLLWSCTVAHYNIAVSQPHDPR